MTERRSRAQLPQTRDGQRRDGARPRGTIRRAGQPTPPSNVKPTVQPNATAQPNATVIGDITIGDIPDAVFATDLDNRITHWADSATTLFGYSAAEAIGQSVGALAAVPDARRHRAGSAGHHPGRQDVARRGHGPPSRWVGALDRIDDQTPRQRGPRHRVRLGRPRHHGNRRDRGAADRGEAVRERRARRCGLAGHRAGPDRHRRSFQRRLRAALRIPRRRGHRAPDLDAADPGR